MSIGRRLFGKVHDPIWKSHRKGHAGPSLEKKAMRRSRRSWVKFLRIK